MFPDQLTSERMQAVCRAWVGWQSPVRSLAKIYEHAHRVELLTRALRDHQDITAYEAQQLLDLCNASLSVWRLRNIWHDALATEYACIRYPNRADLKARVLVAQGMSMDALCCPDAAMGQQMAVEAARQLIAVGGRPTALRVIAFIYNACIPDIKSIRRATDAVPTFVLANRVYVV